MGRRRCKGCGDEFVTAHDFSTDVESCRLCHVDSPPEADLATLRARLTEVEAERDSLRTVLAAAELAARTEKQGISR